MKQTCTIGGFSSEWVENTPDKKLKEEKSEQKQEVVIETKKEKTIRKKEYDINDERNKMIQYAFNLWWWELVWLMECENSTRNPFRQSEVVKNWRREPSFWLCMIDKDFHPEIINDWRFWEDWRFQVETCHRLRKWGTKFYWPWRRIAKAGMKCSDYVKDRFIIK